MAMIYTLVTSAQEWLSERFGQDANIENDVAEVAAKDDVWAFSNFFSFLSPLFYFSFVSYILCVYVVSVSEHSLAKYMWQDLKSLRTHLLQNFSCTCSSYIVICT